MRDPTATGRAPFARPPFGPVTRPAGDRRRDRCRTTGGVSHSASGHPRIRRSVSPGAGAPPGILRFGVIDRSTSPRGDRGRRSSVRWEFPRSRCVLALRTRIAVQKGTRGPWFFLPVGYLKCLVPVCPCVMLNRVTSRSALRTRGAGPLAHQQARPRGRSIWSLAVGKPGLSC